MALDSGIHPREWLGDSYDPDWDSMFLQAAFAVIEWRADQREAGDDGEG